MKKITLLLSFIFCAFMVNAQTIVFEETFGENGATANPRARISEYDDYDNGAPIVFSETNPDIYADIRATTNINTHVWFPAAKETDLIISNIPTGEYENLKLSFDFTCNNKSGDLNKLILSCNGEGLELSSKVLEKQNEYVNSGEIALPNAETVELRFLYTAENNPTGYGYRLDNVKITGTPKESSGINEIAKRQLYVADGQIHFEALGGELVEVFNTVGQKVHSQTALSGLNSITPNAQGILIVKIGKEAVKVRL
ncbi:MAG: hypothetical protein LBH90_10020 [Tannerella sp.]|nr:hypothetical protein [Tannerella sp.]